MAHWDSTAKLCTFLTLDDISKATKAKLTGVVPPTKPNQKTPLLKLIQSARDKGYHTICLPLTTEKWKERWERMCLLPEGQNSEEGDEAQKEGQKEKEKEAEMWRRTPGFKAEEVTITRLDEAEGIIAMVSEWLELDATDDGVRHDAEIALGQELAYASYLNIQTAILPAPRNRDHVASYARIVNSCLARLPFLSLSVRLPIYNPSAIQSEPALMSPNASLHPASPLTNIEPPRTPSVVVSNIDGPNALGGAGPSLNATWEMWDLIRSMCDYNPRLTLTLDLSPALPTTLGVLSKWAAEAVSHIFLPSSTFIANQKGYPVLPKPTQQFIRDSMIHKPVVILSGVTSGHHSNGGEAAYSQYVRHLEKTSAAVQAAQRPGAVENFAQGYQDFLQAPLQPLMDNLPSVTYQTFEQDPVKYAQYEEAMCHAFLDKPIDQHFVVCVAGAGRGPLVARCLTALQRSQRSATVYAVEKNPNAYVTLQQRKAAEWGERVHLVFGDMRIVDVPEPVDILVSELLGSFGDNELSPECLDGAMRFLKPDGISIPSSYTAHLAPLSSSKLYNEARSSNNEKSLETPYVVMFSAVNILSGTKATVDGRCGPQVQECWEFEHPRRDAVLDSRGIPLTNNHNVRSAKLRFFIPHAGILHISAVWQDILKRQVLYGSIGLSIHPHRQDQVSKDMLSWFPLFFPFKEPLYLPSNSELQVSIWRLTNERQVWYEWHAESFLAVPGDGQVEEVLLSPLGAGPSQSFSTLGMPSPLIDSKELSFTETGKTPNPQHTENQVVKIGHTSLHNPGGRSSWIAIANAICAKDPAIYPSVKSRYTPTNMKTSLATLAAFVYLLPGVMALTINTPFGVTQCQPQLITWSDGTPPYYVSIIPEAKGGQPSAPALRSWDPQSGNSLTWQVDLQPNTSITLAIKDATGNTAFSDKVNIQPATPGTACSQNADALATTAATSPAAGTAAAGSSTGAANRPTVGASANASQSNAARPASSTPAVAVGTSSGAPRPSATSASGTVSNLKVENFALVGIAGLAVAFFL
ncbi:hypothetical protein CVT24_006691 [Panaeolus cyanescens]|uniref:Protein arginine N-methyltransferase n=1 Tax=Panaeolus cyanescens TaxID=181874 RepID=A0A409YRX5_9AGAR|nr:hypothetical protein CVT24_006691 [Panaeolus cyanescens]